MKASLHSCKRVLLSGDLNLMIRNIDQKGPANSQKKTGSEPLPEKYHVDQIYRRLSESFDPDIGQYIQFVHGLVGCE
jgi:hypothetical protein